MLLAVYGGGLVFSFRTNRDPLRPAGHGHAQTAAAAAIILLAIGDGSDDDRSGDPGRGARTCPASIWHDRALRRRHRRCAGRQRRRALQRDFGRAKNDMTLALEISVGSSAQIALMVAPVLVLLGPLLGAADVAGLQRLRDRGDRAVGRNRDARRDRRREQLARRASAAGAVSDPRRRLLHHSWIVRRARRRIAIATQNDRAMSESCTSVCNNFLIQADLDCKIRRNISVVSSRGCRGTSLAQSRPD